MKIQEIIIQAETILSKHGDQPIFSLSLNDFVTVTTAAQYRASLAVNPPEEKHYTRKELLDLLGVSYPTLLEHEKRGLLSRGKLIGRKHIYSQSDLDNYLNRIPKAPCCKVG